MNPQQFQKLFEDTVTQMREILLKKGNDYEGTGELIDRLESFKAVAAVCKIKPVTVALVMVSMKVVRLATLTANGQVPTNESINDSALDMCCYSILNKGVIQDTIT